MAIYIPQRIRVGYQEREDTFTKKLAYVIYYDNFGKLRKERSWENWRDEEIEPQEFDNVPTSGFVLNKGHTRHSWSHFGGNTTRIRIFDPRGIEFEITAENLVGVLMHTDCSRREIAGELVYAWNGTELMLLPCCSEEYESARKFTALQEKKFSAKELKEGCTYITKSEQKVVYLGRLDWWEWQEDSKDDSRTSIKRHKKTRKHVFAGEDSPSGWSYNREKVGDYYYRHIVPSAVLAAQVSDVPPDNFATLVDDFLNKTTVASEIERFEISTTEIKHRSLSSFELDRNGNALAWTEEYGGGQAYYSYLRDATGYFCPYCAYALSGGRYIDLTERRTTCPRGNLVKVYKNGVKDGPGY